MKTLLAIPTLALAVSRPMLTDQQLFWGIFGLFVLAVVLALVCLWMFDRTRVLRPEPDWRPIGEIHPGSIVRTEDGMLVFLTDDIVERVGLQCRIVRTLYSGRQLHMPLTTKARAYFLPFEEEEG